MQTRPSLELRQRQHLALTPALQQSIRFLQLSTHELTQEIAQALLENPLLERDPEYATDDEHAEANADAIPVPNGDWSVAKRRRGATSTEDDSVHPEAALPETLADHLLRQLQMTRVGLRERALTALLIDELDDKGYLATPLNDILDCLPPKLRVQDAELYGALRRLQSFDPVGVGATSLADCLGLQLTAMAQQHQANCAKTMACAQALVDQHLDLLASGNMKRLRDAMRCEPHVLRDAHALLLQLDPRPGNRWSSALADYVVPEVLVRKHGSRWVASVNPGVIPRLRVNSIYERMLANTSPSPMHDQLQMAHGLVRNVNQRFLTLARVTQAIVERQSAFFDQGPSALRPLLLRDIATQLQMHESTVSRATRQKYAQTPWGVMELKQFFGTALARDDGSNTSAAAVQLQIRRLVAQEPATRPLSDSKIAQRLTELGVVIAHRTVAKYREAAGIEPAIKRRARAALQDR